MYYAQKGMLKEFAAELGKSTDLYGFPGVGGRLQHAYEQSGREGVLRQWAKELERLAAANKLYMPGALAQPYAALGDKETLGSRPFAPIRGSATFSAAPACRNDCYKR